MEHHLRRTIFGVFVPTTKKKNELKKMAKKDNLKLIVQKPCTVGKKKNRYF